VPAFLGNPDVVDDPGHDRPPLLDNRQNAPPHFGQHGFVVPGSLRHQMVQRLPGRLHAVGMEPGRHRLDALALARQQKAFAVVLQWLVPVRMPGGVGQAFQISRQALLLRTWPRRLGREQTILSENVLFMT
jgi:hypothetical protein